MSVLSEKVRKALFAKSNVAALVGTGKLTAIYDSNAPEDAVIPYGVMNRVSNVVTHLAFGVTNILEDDLWQMTVVCDEDSSTTKEPQEFAADTLNDWESTLGTTLTLTGATVEFMYRTGDIPKTDELVNDRIVYRRGFNFRVKTVAS